MVDREVEARGYMASGRVMKLSTPGLFLVANGRGNNYIVDLVERACTCPDYVYRGTRCKHLIAAEIFDLQQKEQIWQRIQQHPSLQWVNNGLMVNREADLSRFNLYEKRILGSPKLQINMRA